MGHAMTINELARRTGEAVERLARWQRAGMLGDGGQLTLADVERVRLIQALLGRGIAEDQVATTLRDHAKLIDRSINRWLGPDDDAQRMSLREAAMQVGMEPDLAARLLQHTPGTGVNASTEGVGGQDVEALGIHKAALERGFTPDALAQLLRVYGEAFSRMAEAEVRLFHMDIYQRFRQDGLSGEALQQQVEDTGDALRELIEPALRYFHRRAWQAAIREDLVVHVAEEAGLWPTLDATGQMPLAVVFVDLCDFTALTAAQGDLAAADVVELFGAVVRRGAHHCAGKVVKQIGDEFMLVFYDPVGAVRFALEVQDEIRAATGLPPARLGVHWGPTLYRDGDYVGATVNIASRVTAQAGPHQVVATEAVFAAGVGDLKDELGKIDLLPMGKRRLRGVPGEMALFLVEPCDPAQLPSSPVVHASAANPRIA